MDVVKQINSLEDIQTLVRCGETDWQQYGNVNIQISPDGRLILFNYTAKAQYENRWNFFERVSRGLILEVGSGRLVAKPFPKFFNWGEGGRTTEADLMRLWEKVDGSLGIVFYDDGRWQVATRGSFISEQARWAQAKLADYDFRIVDRHIVLLVEIIYPDNRVVVDYGSRAELVLLEAVDMEDLGMLPEVNLIFTENMAEFTGMRQPRYLDFDVQIEVVLDRLRSTRDDIEGYVGLFADGSRFKFKTDYYIERHKWIFGLTKKAVGKAMLAGTIMQMWQECPDEMLMQFNDWHRDLKESHRNLMHEIVDIYSKSPAVSAPLDWGNQDPIKNRPEFAKWVMKNHKVYQRGLFLLFDDRDDDFYEWCLKQVVDKE